MTNNGNSCIIEAGSPVTEGGTALASGAAIAAAERVVRETFGLPGFRSLQRDIVGAVLAGHDVLGVLPTGGGKSLCYQVPTVLQSGATLVVSPLLSLMKDQVESPLLARAGLAGKVCAINSQLEPAVSRQVLSGVARGQYRLIFAAPERLRSRAFQRALARARIGLLAVDEAHCVSQWGHDFRPDYRLLAALREQLGCPPVLALTATATPAVQADLLAQLGIPGARRFVASCDRPNLYLSVDMCRGHAAKVRRVAELVRGVRRGQRHGAVLGSGPGPGLGPGLGPGSAIVYVDRRREAEEWAITLSAELRQPVYCYHAGMSSAERTRVQEAFMAGDVQTVVATNAFGMGIDKPDIRLVVHAGVPGSVEAYYQEIGRAGRDGQPAACHLVLGGDRELGFRRWLIAQSRLEREDIAVALRPLLEAGPGAELDIAQPPSPAWPIVLAELQTRRSVEVNALPSGHQQVRLLIRLDPGLTREFALTADRHHEQREKLLQEMERYVGEEGCRRRFLLNYFGQSLEGRPQRCCDRCDARLSFGWLRKG